MTSRHVQCARHRPLPPPLLCGLRCPGGEAPQRGWNVRRGQFDEHLRPVQSIVVSGQRLFALDELGRGKFPGRPPCGVGAHAALPRQRLDADLHRVRRSLWHVRTADARADLERYHERHNPLRGAQVHVTQYRHRAAVHSSLKMLQLAPKRPQLHPFAPTHRRPLARFASPELALRFGAAQLRLQPGDVTSRPRLRSRLRGDGVVEDIQLRLGFVRD